MARVPHTIASTWPAGIDPGRFAATIRRDSSEGCAVALIGLPDDTGVSLNHGRPGAARGPSAFRDALARLGVATPFRAPLPGVFDAGDVDLVPGQLEENHARVSEATAALLARGLFPIAVGGGHDLTFPFVRSVAARHSRLSGVYFDAHLDVRPTRGSGMAFRKLVEECGVGPLHLHGFRPLVNSAEHVDWFKKHGGTIHRDGPAVRLPGGKAAAGRRSPAGKPRRSATGGFFVSFDLDVLDSAFAPGVSAPNPAGWSVRTAEAWLEACGAWSAVRCLDLMELNPRHDVAGRTARVAAHLFLSFLAGFARRGESLPARP